MSVSVELANGCTLHSGWSDGDDPDAMPAGDWLSVDDPSGNQIFYREMADLVTPQDLRRAVNDLFIAMVEGGT